MMMMMMMMMIFSAGCDEEEQCSLVDVRQDDSDVFHSCLLFPDSTVCGAYDKKLRQPCRPLLARRPNNAHKKKGEISISRLFCSLFKVTCGECQIHVMIESRYRQARYWRSNPASVGWDSKTQRTLSLGSITGQL